MDHRVNAYIRTMGRLWLIATFAAALGFWTASASAQELVPRAHWPAPKGTDLLVIGYQHTSGDVVTDASLPIQGVDSTVNYMQVTYQHTLSLFGRTSNIQANLPYAWGTTEGVVEGQYRKRDISAMADARFQFSINLLGGPSMNKAEFRALRAKPRPIIGASLLIQAPTGDYDKDKIINAGSNRWSSKFSLGGIWPVRPTLLLEAEAGVWVFGDNDEFVGTTRKQDPIGSAEFHLVKRFKPGFWASLDLNYYVGGRTTVDDVQADMQRNSRIGATAVIPLKPRHAIRTSYSTGILTNSGGDYESFTLSYAYLW